MIEERAPSRHSPCSGHGVQRHPMNSTQFNAIGIDVGDVVGDDVELAAERHLPRKPNEKGILHRYTPQTRKMLVSTFLRVAAGSPKPRRRMHCRSRANEENFVQTSA